LHEMLSRFDLLLKLRARNLDEMRDIVVNKVRKFPRIFEIELMTTLKTSKEEQIIDLSTSE
jgi:Lrp/AsnC family transcriptional regulator, regulator for asnA, asnC and gidA